MVIEQLTFTDWPRGQGVDPDASGLQVKACSAGVDTALRKRLAGICMHLGQAFTSSHAPQTAISAEEIWLTQTTSRKQVPVDVLEKFPVIWSYDQLEDDLFALIRTTYTCLTHDGRTGNFLAQALIFPPDALADLDYHPLALAQTSIFNDMDSSDSPILPTLTDFGAVRPQSAYENLRISPFNEHFAAMAEALSTATPASRPMLVCLRDWRQAMPLVESLVSLFPPAKRCRLTFSTYESERTWIAPVPGGRPTGVSAAHHLLVICPPDERPLNLRPDEYQSVFAVFNFAEGRFSDLKPPGDYATFVGRCVEDDQLSRLRQHHDLIEQFGVSHDLAAWNSLVTAVDIPEGLTDRQWLATAVTNLISLAIQPSLAVVALETIWPHIQALVQANDATGLAISTSQLAALSDTAAEGGQDFLAKVVDLIRDSLEQGHVETAVSLLDVCGQARPQMLQTLLKEISDSNFDADTTGDWEQWIQIFLEGIHLSEQQPESVPPQHRLTLAAFRAGAKAGRSADVWNRLGDTVVKPYLGGDWAQEKQRFAQELATWLPPDDCPEGNAWLNLKRLEKTKPKGEKIQTLLEHIVYAGARCDNAEELMMAARKTAEEQSPDETSLAVMLGRMAESGCGTTVDADMYDAYQNALQSLNSKQRNRVHRELAKRSVAQTLCRELLADMLPWNEAESPKKWQRWQQIVLQNSPNTTELLYQQTASLLQQPERTTALIPLVIMLLPREPEVTAVTPGLSVFYTNLIHVLPLVPLSDSWAQVLTAVPDGLTAETKARWRLLAFMRQVTEQASDPKWSLADFPETDKVWQQDVPALSTKEKESVLAWCAKIVAVTGITTPLEAKRLVSLLDKAGESDPINIAAFVEHLLIGRDQVTEVIVATAFARCYLEAKQPDARWGQIVAALAAQFDKNTHRLLEAHLARRFALQEAAYEAHLNQLRNMVGFSTPMTSFKPTQTVIDDDQPPKQDAMSPIGMLGSATRRLRRLIGGSKSKHESE